MICSGLNLFVGMDVSLVPGQLSQATWSNSTQSGHASPRTPGEWDYEETHALEWLVKAIRRKEAKGYPPVHVIAVYLNVAHAPRAVPPDLVKGIERLVDDPARGHRRVVLWRDQVFATQGLGTRTQDWPGSN